MELSLSTCSLGVLEYMPEVIAENPFDVDLTLPEYYPDVQRILRCTVQPNIHSTGVQADRITVEGNGILRILYLSDAGDLSQYEQNIPISKSVSIKGQNREYDVTVNAKTSFANCRATGQRKISVHGVISLKLTGFYKCDKDVICASEGSLLQCKENKLKTLSLASCVSRCFSMSEVVDLSNDKPPIECIHRCNSAVKIESIKAIKDKMLLKGELITEIVYSSSGDYTNSIVLRHSMPLSQIVESEGISEDNIQDLCVNVISLDAIPKTDSNGDARLLEIAARVQVSVISSEMRDFNLIEEAYSTKGELKAEYKNINLRTVTETLHDTFTAKQEFDLSSNSFSELIDVSYGDLQSVFTVREDSATIECSVPISMVYKDVDGYITCAEKMLDFTYKKGITETRKALRCNPDVQVLSCNNSVEAGKVIVKVDALVSGTVYSDETVCVLTGAEVLDAPQDECPSAITIYFSDAGERVWDIAKRYRTTVDSVMKENELQEDCLPEKRMLIIPTA